MAGPVAEAELGRVPWVRGASALVLGTLAVAVAIAGGWYFAVAMLAVALLMAWEWARLVGAGLAWPLPVAIALLWLAAVSLPAAVVFALPVGVGLAASVSGFGRWSGAGAVYVGVPLASVLWLRDDPASGASIVLWLFAVVWATDVGAYAIGRSIGGLRLAPTWSPKKTWAGAVGGVTGALATTAVLIDLGMDRQPWLLLLAAGFVSVLAQVGDMVESIVKRRFQRKDSGNLIPGHGGILDRLDSMVFAAPGLALLVAVSGRGAWLWGINGE